MATPTFLIIGAAKSGTTSLYYQLDRHPDVYFSDPKEPVFFEVEYERGLDFYRSKYFSGWSGERAVGEGRVYNLYLPFVPQRIRDTLPSAKLIVILRNPVDRAYSHWWHRVTRGYETRSFENAVGDEIRRLEKGQRFELATTSSRWKGNFYAPDISTADLRQVPLVEMGYYSEQLKRYRQLFPSSQLRVLLFEDLTRDPVGLVENLCSFLRVGPPPTPIPTEPRNTAEDRIKSQLAFRLERLTWRLRLHRAVPKLLRSWVRGFLPHEEGTRPQLSANTRANLAEHYFAFNCELGEMLGRDLAHWHRPVAPVPDPANS